jgi:hypothetical protein
MAKTLRYAQEDHAEVLSRLFIRIFKSLPVTFKYSPEGVVIGLEPTAKKELEARVMRTVGFRSQKKGVTWSDKSLAGSQEISAPNTLTHLPSQQEEQEILSLGERNLRMVIPNILL